MVGDDMFATEGDSANVGRQRTATRENGRSSGPAPVGADGGQGGEVSADVLRRLRERVDRNVRLVDRMRADPLAPEPPGLPELIDTARRMRHDAETLLLLAGIDPGPRPGAPARLSALLDEAVDATDEPMRVDVRTGPNATVEPGAAIELLHVVSEVVDHVTAIHPGGRVEVASRTEAPGGIVVEIRTASTTRYDPAGRLGMAAATRIARQSRSGLVLRTPLPGPAGGGAPIATIHCPARSVTVHELDYSPWPGETSYDALGRPGIGGSNGTTHHDLGRDAELETPAHGLPLDPPGERASPRTTVEALFSELTAETNARAAGRHGDDQLGDQVGGQAGTDRFGAYGRASGPRNGRPHPAAVPVDELFGPMVDLPVEQLPESTPIYEAVASAWFVEDAANGSAVDWESPSDLEWRAAAERAAHQSEDVTFTAEGLPRRRPGGRLVPPRLSDGRADGDGAHARPAATPTERVPDRVRERLATYQRGLRQGRHRAEPVDPGDPAAW